jgi:hypothetical protein
MGKSSSFERELRNAEQLLERLQQAAELRIARARAELASLRDEIYWRDEDLPF